MKFIYEKSQRLRQIVVRVLASVVVVVVAVGLTPSAAGAWSGNDYPAVWKNLPINSGYDSWGYAIRNCTSWVAWALHSRNGFEMPRGAGNASQWASWARSRGYQVNNNPAVGAVAWWPGGNHVAWVSAVNSNGTVVIEEYNNPAGSGAYRMRTISISSVQFIHLKSVSSVAKSRNLYAINRQGVGSNSTELHIVNIDRPSQFVMNAGTALHKTDANWSFAVGDYNRDGIDDIYAFNRRDAAANSTSVHILNGANPYQFLSQSKMNLPQTNADWSFDVGDYNGDGMLDIYAIDRQDEGSNSTAIHVINGANLQERFISSGTALHKTDANWSFAVGDYSGDGRYDLYAINKKDTHAGRTSLHIINAGNFGQFLLHSPTALHITNDHWQFAVKDFNRDGRGDLYAFATRDAGSNSTAVHVINGSNPGQFLINTGTVLHQTNETWSLR